MRLTVQILSLLELDMSELVVISTTDPHPRLSQMAVLPLELKAIRNGIKVPLQKLFFGELNSSCIIWKWILNLGKKQRSWYPSKKVT